MDMIQVGILHKNNTEFIENQLESDDKIGIILEFECPQAEKVLELVSYLLS